MKSADIKPGTDYGYSRWNNYHSLDRVTVLEVGVTGPDANSNRWGSGPDVSGLVKIQYQQGGVENVRPQTIKMPWSQYHGEKVAEGKRKAERAREEQAERERRAGLAFTMHQRLLTAGASLELVAVYDDEDREALLKAGFFAVPNVDGSFAHEVFSAVEKVDDLMDKGTVSLDDVAVLIDEANPATNPEYDGLGGYDSDYFDPEDWAALEAAYLEASKVGRP